MRRFAASLTMMFNEWPLPERFQAARDAGFEAVELQAPYGMRPDEIGTRLAASGLELVLINAPPGPGKGERGLASLPGREAEFRAGVEMALNYAEATGARQIHILSGAGPTCDAGVWEVSMRWAAERLAVAGVTALLEPLNQVDNPGYFLSDFDWAAAAVERIGAPNLRLQFDVYHRQMMRGEIIDGLRRLAHLIGHVQIAGVPGRNEPAACEVDFPVVMQELDRLGYAGWIGAEYRPRAGTLAGLGWLQQLRVACD